MKEEYACSSKYAWRKMEEKVLILDTTAGDYFLLNETASLIWEGLLSQQEPREICRTLVEAYELSEEKALRDVKELIQRLKAERFLVVSRVEI